MAITYLNLDSSCYSGAEHRKLEVCFEAGGKVERDDIHVEALACLLQGALVGGPGSNQVIMLLQLGDAEIGCRVSEEDVTAAQDAYPGRYGERQAGGYGGSLVVKGIDQRGVAGAGASEIYQWEASQYMCA